LIPKNADRSGSGAVAFLGTIGYYMAQKIKILLHDFKKIDVKF